MHLTSAAAIQISLSASDLLVLLVTKEMEISAHNIV